MWVGERWPSALPTHFVRRRAGACERIFGADLSSCTRGGDAGPWSLLGEPSGDRTQDPLIKSSLYLKVPPCILVRCKGVFNFAFCMKGWKGVEIGCLTAQ